MSKRNLARVLSLSEFRGFISTAVPLILSQFGCNLPGIVNDIQIGALGDIEVVTIAGLCFTYFSLMNYVFSVATVETVGAGCAKAFGARNYFKMVGLLYKGLFVIILINGFYVAMTCSFCSKLLMFINVDQNIAERTKIMAIVSSPGYFFHSVNMLLQAYLMSQNIIKELNYNALISAILALFAGYYFIIIKNYKEIGFAYSILIQETVSLLLNLFFLFKRALRETLVLPNASFLAHDLIAFSGKCFYSILSVYGEYFFWEINTIIVSKTQKLDDLAAWMTFVSLSFVAYTISMGISNAFRTRIGQVIGEGNFYLARQTSIVYYFYIFLFSLILSFFFSLFAGELAYIFIRNQDVVEKVKLSVYILSGYMFPFLTLNTFFSIFRLLDMDKYFFKMQTIVVPITGLIFSLSFVFGFKMGFQGVVVSQGIVYTAIVIIFFFKIYLGTNWENQTNAEKRLSLIENI